MGWNLFMAMEWNTKQFGLDSFAAITFSTFLEMKFNTIHHCLWHILVDRSLVLKKKKKKTLIKAIVWPAYKVRNGPWHYLWYYVLFRKPLPFLFTARCLGVTRQGRTGTQRWFGGVARTPFEQEISYFHGILVKMYDFQVFLLTIVKTNPLSEFLHPVMHVY